MHTTTNLRYSYAKFFVTVHDHAPVWFIEDICNAGADVIEQPDLLKI